MPDGVEMQTAGTLFDARLLIALKFTKHLVLVCNAEYLSKLHVWSWRVSRRTSSNLRTLSGRMPLMTSKGLHTWRVGLVVQCTTEDLNRTTNTVVQYIPRRTSPKIHTRTRTRTRTPHTTHHNMHRHLTGQIYRPDNVMRCRG